ncbi:MAG: hypothetical protein Q8O22_05450 [Candidatus Omnitrophota bacterium]|nr:hypothetical protein [Candidatus Omnitrophota bacterium]
MRRYLRSDRGQAVVEFAIFGGIMLIVFGILFSFIQRFNDQQYVQMETFRRALDKACTHLDGTGASVQYTFLEDRRHADLSGNFYKGSPTTLSASANVFWAVPDLNAPSESLIVFRVNDDEYARKYRDFIPVENDGEWSFRTEEMATSSDSIFKEASKKIEDQAAITNERRSWLSETKTIRIPYTIRKNDDDEDDENDEIIKEGEFWEGYPAVSASGELTQYLYRDADGQYKYSSTAVEDGKIERSRTWKTPVAR